MFVYLFVWRPWAYQRHQRLRWGYAEFSADLPCGIVRTKQATHRQPTHFCTRYRITFRERKIPFSDSLGHLQQPTGHLQHTICVLIHLIRHRNAVEVSLSAFRYNHIKAKIKSLISLLIALYTHNIQTFYLFLIGTQVTLFSKKANWHTRRNRVVKVIYVCMCPA